MKALMLLFTAIISNVAWANLSQIQKVLADPQVQRALPYENLLSVTVGQQEAQTCLLNYVVYAQYPSGSCSMNVGVDTCGLGSSVLGPVNCESTAVVMETAAISPETTPSFARDIRPMFKAKCTACSGSGKMNPKDWTDYATAVANKGLITQRVIVKKDMPMGGWDQASRDKVAAWINGGTPN